ncbi:MAG: L,D-transpeptidase family protein [Bacteroidales bacterium]|nr:L,D-transpeptidase family protein [Bacteroidales bacterium]MCF6341523.1 L,D-transpeptidase family protein [Bacteroidales bacterium]
MILRRLTFFILINILFFFALQAQENGVQQLIKQRVEKGLDNKSVAAAGIVLFSQNELPVFYTNRESAPAWVQQRNMDELLTSLEHAYDEGLNPNDYHLKDLRKLLQLKEQNKLSVEAAADLDMLLTDALLLYASHLVLGKVDQSKIRPGWDIPLNSLPQNVDSLLAAALESSSIQRELEKLKPQNFMYVHMKKGLERLREISENGGFPAVPEGEVLKKGMVGERIVALRKYLSITGDLSSTDFLSDSLDEGLEAAVKQFQFRHNLNQDGVIGKETLAQMNVPVEQRINTLRLNLERARWVMHQLQPDFLVVNIAGFNIRRLTNEEVVFYSRVIVGKNHHESPIFKSKLTYFVINPTWTLPYSIATKETLPKLKKNPAYLAEKNMEIMNRDGKILDPSTIDFSQYSRSNFPFTVRQKAGPHNALGQVKFMFPNHYAVYLHDTPARSLFEREARAFSHGCIRLDKKWDLLMNLTGEPDVWNMEKINAVLKSGETTTVKLKNPIDIIILYWTAGADKQDRLYFNKDVYDRDMAVLKALDTPVHFKKIDY